MMKKYFLILMVSLLTTAAMSQVNKVPADTRLYLQTLENINKQAARRSLNGTVKQHEAKLFVSCTPDADTKAIEARIKTLGASPQGTIGRYIMVSSPVGVVDQIAAIEDVTYISKGPRAHPKTLITREVTGVSMAHHGADGLPQAFTGKDVVVGLIDGGFDFAHPAFRDTEGNLRIKAYYTPGMTPHEGDTPIVTLDGEELAGRAFTTPEDILAEESDMKWESHGTHCAASAAGSTFDCAGGMAPDADIILCSYDISDRNDVEDPSYFTAYNIIQSIFYIRDYAKRVGKPYVVSMSLNGHDGPHDGTSFISYMLNELALANTNMTLAASNEGAFDCYVNHQFAANDTLHTIASGSMEISAFTRQSCEASFQIGLYDPLYDKEVWRSEPLRSDNGGCSFNLDFSEEGETGTDIGQCEDIKTHLTGLFGGKIIFSIGKLEDGRVRMSLEIHGKLNMYDWSIHIASPENTEVDMWGDGYTQYVGVEGSDYYTAGNSSVSMGDWGTGGNIITVGSWTSKPYYINIDGQKVMPSSFGISDEGVGAYTPFSSYGTDLTGHNHPFVSTPGSMIISALNHYDNSYDSGAPGNIYLVEKNAGFSWGVMSGTSMATPAAAGIIALWLQAKPDLTYDEIKETIIASSVKDQFTESAPIRYGHGKMDAYKGLLHILGITTSIPTLSRHQPDGVTFRMHGDQLFIEGADDGTPIRIYTTTGRLVASTTLTGGCVSLPPATPSGVYAVQVGTLGSTLIRK